MKKFIAVLLVVMLSLTLAACGDSAAQKAEEELQKAKETYASAVEQFNIAQENLPKDFSRAEQMLAAVSENEVADPAVLDTLRSVLEEAQAATEWEVTEIPNETEKINEQASEILAGSEKINSLANELANTIYDVEMSQQRWKEENRTEIIMAKLEASSQSVFTIYGIDPETGEQRTISTITVPSRVSYNSDGTHWASFPMYVTTYKRLPLKMIFSADYKKVAVTTMCEENDEWHAGCYEENENLSYIDVTKNIDAVGGDFDEPVKHLAVGFTDDDKFIFGDLPKTSFLYYDEDTWKGVYQVDVADNKSAIKSSLKDFDEMNNLLMLWDDWDWHSEVWRNVSVTDWIDDTHCLIDYPEKYASLLMGGERIDRWGVRILDITTKETTPFIPGESRSNWNGVISPDGESVAFLSVPVNGTDNAALYVTSINGGEPVKICDNLPATRDISGNVLNRIANNGTFTYLIEWRKVK